jgi:hypothetical protein
LGFEWSGRFEEERDVYYHVRSLVPRLICIGKSTIGIYLTTLATGEEITTIHLAHAWHRRLFGNLTKTQDNVQWVYQEEPDSPAMLAPAAREGIAPSAYSLPVFQHVLSVLRQREISNTTELLTAVDHDVFQLRVNLLRTPLEL